MCLWSPVRRLRMRHMRRLWWPICGRRWSTIRALLVWMTSCNQLTAKHHKKSPETTRNHEDPPEAFPISPRSLREPHTPIPRNSQDRPPDRTLLRPTGLRKPSGKQTTWAAACASTLSTTYKIREQVSFQLIRVAGISARRDFL